MKAGVYQGGDDCDWSCLSLSVIRELNKNTIDGNLSRIIFAKYKILNIEPRGESSDLDKFFLLIIC